MMDERKQKNQNNNNVSEEEEENQTCLNIFTSQVHLYGNFTQ